MGLLTVGQPIAFEASDSAAAMLVLKEGVRYLYAVLPAQQADAVSHVEITQSSETGQSANSLGSLLQ